MHWLNWSFIGRSNEWTNSVISASRQALRSRLFSFAKYRDWEGSRIEHAALAIALGTLPCLQTYVAQANFWLAPIAGLCALSAAILTLNRTDGLANWSELLDLKFAPPLLLMLIAAAVYQPMLSWY